MVKLLQTDPVKCERIASKVSIISILCRGHALVLHESLEFAYLIVSKILLTERIEVCNCELLYSFQESCILIGWVTPLSS